MSRRGRRLAGAVLAVALLALGVATGRLTPRELLLERFVLAGELFELLLGVSDVSPVLVYAAWLPLLLLVTLIARAFAR